MMEIVGVGIATIDIIQEVNTYPEEDSKIRALSSRKTRGGNVTNALAVSAQLGCSCHWIGTMTNPEHDNDAAFVTENLQSFGINTNCAAMLTTGAMPVSYILASKATGSRTIIHHRDLPELSVEAFCHGYGDIAVTSASSRDQNQRSGLWTHFEGRNLANVEQMMQFLRDSKQDVPISLEVEALRNDWEHIQRMLQLVNVAFVSKDYIRKKLGHKDATAFFEYFRSMREESWRLQTIVCPWGADGVYFMDIKTQSVHHITTTPLENALDTVGAGDTFIGAALAAFAHGLPAPRVLEIACRVATAKCMHRGFQLPNELLDEVRLSLQ